MSTSFTFGRGQADWWEQLGLTSNSMGVTRNRHDASNAGLSVLREYQPVAFVSKSDTSDQLTIEQLHERVAEAERRYKRETEEATKRAVQELDELGWERIEAAYAAPDADEVIQDGGWSGFTRADATAWCWNLFQFELRGIAHPGSEVRVRASLELKAGGLPEVFGYPQRARELVALGLTPKQYRQHKEALGARPVFASYLIQK